MMTFTNNHLRNGLTSLAFTLVLGLSLGVTATAGGLKKCDQTGVQCCPVCDHRCTLDAKPDTKSKTCFEVESKVICIPRVVFPWQKRKAGCAGCDSCDGNGCTACVNNGARLRRICVLKKDKITCPSCKYTWSAEKKAGCCDMPVVETVTADSAHQPVWQQATASEQAVLTQRRLQPPRPTVAAQ